MTLTLGGEILCASFDWINKLSEATHAMVVYIIVSCIFVVFVIYGCLHQFVLHICDLGCFTMSATAPSIL